MRSILLAAEGRAKKILTARRKELDMMGQALLDYETIHGEDLPRLFDGKPLLRVGTNGKANGKAAGSARKKKTSGKAATKSTNSSASAKPKK